MNSCNEELWEPDYKLKEHIIDLFLSLKKSNEYKTYNLILFMLENCNRQQLIQNLICIQKLADE